MSSKPAREHGLKRNRNPKVKDELRFWAEGNHRLPVAGSAYSQQKALKALHK